MAGTTGTLFDKTACENSDHRTQIDIWLNEGRANAWISRELQKQFGEKISDKSVGKYRAKREEYLQKELMANPDYVAKVNKVNREMATHIGQIKEVDVLGHLANTIEHCAELIGQSKLDDIHIKNIQDLRYVQMTMLEALKVYGETMQKAQAMQKVEEDPSLLQPKITVNVQQTLVDMFQSMTPEQKFAMIDGIRNGVNK